jgi:hypothetical protein
MHPDGFLDLAHVHPSITNPSIYVDGYGNMNRAC